jgi:two-component system, NarL family, nitrate/nitrite response regulator NarL
VRGGQSRDSEGVASSVLIVDDCRSFAGAARLLLERQGVRVVGEACTSADAVELVASLQPDVVLVDLMLGDESGLDLARLLARRGSGDAPAVILISACSRVDVEELMAASPASGFLPKSDLSADAIRRIVGDARIYRATAR